MPTKPPTKRLSPHAFPMGRAEPGDTFVDCYMDLTNWECAIGCANRTEVYASVEACRVDNERCIDECGIVKVRVQFLRVVQKPMDMAERARRAQARKSLKEAKRRPATKRKRVGYGP